MNMSTPCKIFVANASHLDTVCKLYEAVCTHSGPVNYSGWVKDVYPNARVAKEGIHTRCLCVATVGQQLAGTFILNQRQPEAYRQVAWQYDLLRPYAMVIHTFAVHPAFARQGIGRAMLQYAEQAAFQNDIQSIRLDVSMNNLPAIRLYESCGFLRRGTVDLGLHIQGLKWFHCYEKCNPVPPTQKQLRHPLG